MMSPHNHAISEAFISGMTLAVPAGMKTFPDLAFDAVTLSRFEFICAFLALETRYAQQRELTGGLRVRRKGGEWVLDMPEVEGAPVLARGPSAIFERAVRSALGRTVARAEEFREAAHIYARRAA